MEEPSSAYLRSDQPIGQQMRKRKQRDDSALAILSSSLVSFTSLDDKIAALENSVYNNNNNNDDDDDDDDNDDDDDDDEDNYNDYNNDNSNRKRKVLEKSSDGQKKTSLKGEGRYVESMRPLNKDKRMTDNMRMEVDAFGNAIRITSALESERIIPLPVDLLPSATRHIQGKKPSKKPAPTSGLEATVREMLREYEPSSREKRPFWCRVCRFQGSSESSLMEHRVSEDHIAAARIERKVSACKLCRKQFTSPEQLRGHLAGRPHRDKLEAAQARQKSGRGDGSRTQWG